MQETGEDVTIWELKYELTPNEDLCSFKHRCKISHLPINLGLQLQELIVSSNPCQEQS